jgi:hypothetical protein
MEKSVRDLFERYEKLFRMALAGEVNMDKVASSYAAAFVAASAAGIRVGQNDEHLKQALCQKPILGRLAVCWPSKRDLRNAGPPTLSPAIISLI